MLTQIVLHNTLHIAYQLCPLSGLKVKYETDLHYPKSFLAIHINIAHPLKLNTKKPQIYVRLLD